MKEIFVAGYPSWLAGGDTELLHNISLWRKYDVDVNLVPMFGEDSRMRTEMDRIGCKTHKYHPSIFKNRIVASWCNGEFLKHLPEIMEQGKPAIVSWQNCMTWTFPLEIEAHKNKWIDYFGFVSNYQKKWLKPELEKYNPVNELDGYRPYFDLKSPQQIEFKYRTPDKWFAIGRISRDDGAKYPSDMWRCFDKVCTPKHKKIFILGFGPNAVKKTGNAPNHLDWQTWGANEVPVKQIYDILHCIIHKTGGSRESYCRIVPEAYASGVPMIVENDYAFPDLIENGVTGYLCNSSDEMSFRASELAFDETKRYKMIHAARKKLENDIASIEKCWEPWKKILA